MKRISLVKSMLIKSIWPDAGVKATFLVDRRSRIFGLVRPDGKRGIEVGALNRPIVREIDGDVRYADHLSTEGLRLKYAEDLSVNYNNFKDLVPVSVVTGTGTLANALGSTEKFDYIIASHVLEHIADPIGWIIDCLDILNDDGIIFLALPDRRFTFDRYRADTTTGELIANYHSKAKFPTPSQVFEYYSRSESCSPEEVRDIWEGKFDKTVAVDINKLKEAVRLEIDVTHNSTYFDCHCSIFTPYSLSMILRELISLAIIPVSVDAIEATREREAEFFVVLRKMVGSDPSQLASTVPRLDPMIDGQTPRRRLSWRSRPLHALRILFSGRAS
ncbi:Methyltransferase domain-containing protein [Methylobacterium sp. UNC300MFChir4.1]|uniref:class I SAM-dependent methyltransferase n=1 Tax=Methylobacterium sp. UNC300MFChir4.1 TaxID=1502747 RepID=UPI0008CC642D|nr:methyltransferase domain-containing protein [Methylobacterium sp. UNC300MFChir4.1]SEP40384.1 Methyltransferase domain-containing protein [Methylobacterium sp. UNC300MFChir4.1]